MTDRLAHRGPDGEGFHVEPGIGLGHRRLSVIDVEAGQQPMYNEDHSVVIVFNGMIYNHLALREQLQHAGHVFRTRCDTEVIIHAWESWGPDCLAHLAGMFAFALWDRRRALLFLARDRLGKKPLYYKQCAHGGLAFASELPALCESFATTPPIDPLAVDDFFAFGYIPEPRTIYEGVYKLPAAHFLLLGHSQAASVEPHRYWHIPFAEHRMVEAEAAPTLRAHLRRSVAERLVADVNLGAFLSGGVDSGAVVATAAQLLAKPVSTFTVGFGPEQSPHSSALNPSDERALAALVAARYGTTHYSTALSVTFDPIEAARAQASIFGEPFGDISSVPTHAVCALARRYVTVALSGDGGDEVFGGYRRYRWHLIAEAVRLHIPAGLRRGVIARLAQVYPKLDWAPRWLRAKHTLTEISLDSALGYYSTFCKLQHTRRRALFSRSMVAQLEGYDPSTRVTRMMLANDEADPLRQAQIVDLTLYLPGDILTKVDRTSMAHGLEVRAPLLDHEIVEWGVGLPRALKQRAAVGKYVLKQAMAESLPLEILYRGKQGFASSPAAAFRKGRQRLRERLLAGPMMDSGLFERHALASVIDEHAGGRFDHSQLLWSLLVFEGFLNQITNPQSNARLQKSLTSAIPCLPTAW